MAYVTYTGADMDKGAVPAGTKVAVATDASGAEHQYVKVEFGSSDSSATKVSAENPLPVAIGDAGNLDAFSRLRVSDPVALFASQCQYDADPLLFEGGATGTGAAPVHNANTRMVALACTAGAGTSYLQSYEYVAYQPGKSQLAFITGLLGAAAAGAVVDVGLFDAGNGIFLRQNGTSGLQIVRRTSTSGTVSNVAVDQADWNLDPLDGTGASGITLDVGAVFILVLEAQFLGMGRVRVGFDIDGHIVFAHEFLNANSLAVPYMQTLALPVQMLVTTASAAKTAYFKCASVSSEGGLSEDLAYQFATPEATVTAGNGARTHLVSLRPTTTFNSLTNRSRLALNSLEVLVTGAQPVLWELALGCVFSTAATSGPSWTALSTAYSAAEVGTSGTLSTSAGSVPLVIASGYVAASQQSKTVTSYRFAQRYPLTLDRAGAARAMGTLSLLVTGIGNTSATRAVFNFGEVR